MQRIEIKILEEGAPPGWPDEPPGIKAIFTKVGILENGTVQGNTSLYFMLTTEHGQPIRAEMTLKILDALHGAAKGADQGFKAKRN